jgi:hypothetical protein
VAAIAAYGEVGIEGAVLDGETRHARTGATDIDRSACAKASAASARSIATFYSEALDVDGLQRQHSCSGNGLVIQTVKDRCTSDGKQSGVSGSRPLERCSVSLDGDVGENDRRRRQPEWVMRIAIPESVKGVHRLLQDDREWPLAPCNRHPVV